MNFVIPSMQFVVGGYLAGMIAGLTMVACLQSGYRLGSVGTWLLFAILIPIPVLAAIPLAGIAYLPTTAALPPTGAAVLVGVFVVHWVLPTLLPDFNTNTFSASALLAVVLGLVAGIVGLLTGDFPDGLVTEAIDPFSGREGGLRDVDLLN